MSEDSPSYTPKKPPKPNLFPTELIERRIYLIRGHKVMLDSDLAQLYDVKPIRLREQVKRNRGRFPEDFMFRLTKSEVDLMVSQNAIPSCQHLGGSLPYVFTEHGALMLASVLNSPIAVQASIGVVRAFVKLHEMLTTHKNLAQKIEVLERKYAKHDSAIKSVFEAIYKLMEPKDPPEGQQIGFQS